MPSARILAVTSLLVALVTILPPAAQANTCLPGTGVLGDEFLVASQADLVKVGSGVDGCDASDRYRQTADITLTGDWTPIAGPFAGTYDGGGFTITGLTVSRAGSNHNGLFGMATTGAVIGDVHLVGASVTGDRFTGLLVGDVGDGSVLDSSAAGTVTSNGSHTGGLIGYGLGATVSGSRFTGRVTSSSGNFVGGLVGDIGSGSVTDSSVTADVSSAGDYVGGVVGYGLGATIERSRFAGTVTTSGEFVGGLVGSWESSSEVSDAYARGRVETSAASRFVGGLIGYADTATLTRAYSNAVVAPASGSTFVGGLTGEGLPASTMETFWDTETSGQARSAAGVGATTAQLTSSASFLSWPIVDGWAAADVGANRVWGICPRVNDGYPFLLWEYSSDPCVEPASAAAPSIAIACTGPDGRTLQAGAVASCILSGVDAGIDILWRAAYNPTVAEGVVRTGSDGTGTFTFTVPAGAAGAVMTVEPVAWAAPIVVGTVEGDTGAPGGLVPTRVPAGGGPAPASTVLSALLVGIVGVAVAPLLAARTRRRSRTSA